MSDASAERPLWFTVMCLLLVLAASIVVGYRAAPHDVGALLPVEVRVIAAADLSPKPPELVALDAGGPGRRYELPPAFHWRIERRPVTALGLLLPDGWREWLQAVEVSVGPRLRRYTADEIEQRWERGSGQAGLRWAPVAELASDGIVARRTTALNGPADADVARRTFAVPALLTLTLILLLSLGRRWGRPLAVGAAADGPGGPAARTWGAFAVGAVAAGLLLVERLDPFYFAQADNLIRLLPVALEACARLNQDAWPEFSPYPLLGLPVAAPGAYGLSYPPLWASCAVAGGILDRPTALYDVFAALHLLVGAAALFALGRREGLSPPLAAGLAVSFALAGVFLVVGRSDAGVLPLAAFLPLLLLSARSLPESRRPFRWTLASGFAIGLLYHAGSPGLWGYAVLAWALMLWLARRGGELERRRLLWALAALGLGLAMALPLLVPQLRFLAALEGGAGGSGHGIWAALDALLLPAPLAEAGHPDGLGAAGRGGMAPLYFSGGLLTLAGLLALAAGLAAWLRGATVEGFRPAQHWVPLAWLALLLCLGSPAILWSLFGLAPGLDRVASPLYLLPFLVLALNLAGALLLERLLPRRGPWHAAVALAVVALALLNAGLARQSLTYFADDPYPPLPEAVAEALRPHGEGLLGPRLLAGGPAMAGAAGYTQAPLHNLSAWHRLPAFNGHDPDTFRAPEQRALVGPLETETRNALRAHGVRWVLLFRPEAAAGPAMPAEAPDRFYSRVAAWRVQTLRPSVEAGNLALYDLGAADPLAFVEDASETPLPLRADADGLRVELPAVAAPRKVVLNFLKRPSLTVAADGARLEVGADKWGRVLVETPAGAGTLRLAYDGGWGRGLFYGLVLALMALALLVVTLRFDPAYRRPAEP